jgi:predicted amidophosphoribosyltransferase
MKSFGDALVTILVLGGILILSGLLTSAFTRRMYLKCSGCGNLNAKRRTHCRVCGLPFEQAHS